MELGNIVPPLVRGFSVDSSNIDLATALHTDPGQEEKGSSTLGHRQWRYFLASVWIPVLAWHLHGINKSSASQEITLLSLDEARGE